MSESLVSESTVVEKSTHLKYVLLQISQIMITESPTYLLAHTVDHFKVFRV